MEPSIVGVYMVTLGGRLVRYLDDPGFRALAGRLSERDTAFEGVLRRASTPSEVVRAFIDNAWDLEAAGKVFSRAYEVGGITRSEYRDLAGEAFLSKSRFDT